MAMNSDSQSGTDVERSPMNSNPEGFTVLMNSDTKIKFCVKTCLVE